MINQVGRMLSVRREEAGPAALLFFYLFLVMGAYLMGQAVGDALFLDIFPRQLPYAMIGSALMAAVFVSVYSRLSTRMRLESLIIASLLFFSLSFVSFWWLTQFQPQFRWVYWLILIWVYTAGAVCPMMGWTLANYTMTTREARRLFGYVGAGALLGGAIISFTTADLVRHGQMRPQTALLVIAALLLACALIVRVLVRNSGTRLASLSRSPAAGNGAPQNFSDSSRMVLGSRYLLMLTALIALGCLATCILGYQFKVIANESYESKQELAAFFGRFNGYMGLASFVFQLALTPLLLTTFGIRVCLFVTPAALMASSLGVMITPVLTTATILRGSHYMLRFSLDKSSTELLYVPVSPDIRSQVKSYIDSFVWRSADGVAGAILWLFTEVMNFSPGQVSFVNMAVLIAWLYVANKVRHEYTNVLRQAVERRTLDPTRTAAQVLDSTTLEVLAQALERGGEQQLMYGMSLFEMSRQPGWHPGLRRLLEHPSSAVRRQALRLLGDAGDRVITPEAEKLLGDESLEVRAEALRYLVVHAGRDPLTLLSGESNLPVYVIQGAVAAYLARGTENDYSSAARLILEGMLSQAGPDSVVSRCEAARVLGLIPAPYELHNRLLGLLHDENVEVAEQALLSAGKVCIPELLPAVIEKLGVPNLVAAARAALIQYDLRGVGMLDSHLNDPVVPLPVRKHIPETLARIPAAESAAVLAHSLLQGDPGLRFDVLKALNKVRDRNPGLLPRDVDYSDLVNAELMGHFRSLQIFEALDGTVGKEPLHGSEQLLKRALREYMDQELERIFRLLALSYTPRDIRNAYFGVSSHQPQLRANALELLENLLPPDLFRRLAFALDPDIDTQKRLDFARRLCGIEVASRTEALRVLLYSGDRWLRACALYAIGGLHLNILAAEVAKVRCDHDPMLTETRDWAAARLSESAHT